MTIVLPNKRLFASNEEGDSTAGPISLVEGWPIRFSLAEGYFEGKLGMVYCVRNAQAALPFSTTQWRALQAAAARQPAGRVENPGCFPAPHVLVLV
jgi:hypothetical protein